MRFVLAALLAISTPVSANVVEAPTSLVIVACRVDDLTGFPGRHDPALAASNWRDLELHVDKNQELDCKREQIDLTDAVEISSPFASIPLHPNFSDWSQCARVGVLQAQEWNEEHIGWGVVAVGCPVQIVNQDGMIVGFKLPECPNYLPGQLQE